MATILRAREPNRLSTIADMQVGRIGRSRPLAGAQPIASIQIACRGLPELGLESLRSCSVARDSPPLAKDACLWRATSPLAEIQLPVQFTVGADGATIRHHAPWPPSVPPELRACLDPMLAGARFNCPLSRAAIVDARLSLAVRAR